MSVEVICPFFNWIPCLLGIESYKFFIFFDEIKPLSEVSLAGMFYHTVGSLFILLMYSLVMQKLFNLM